MLSSKEFKAHAQAGFNRIPLVAEVLADLDTPLSVFLKLVGDQAHNAFLLESVVGGERFGRYSFIGLPTKTLVRVRGFGDAALCEVVSDGVVQEAHHANPLNFLVQYEERFRPLQLAGLPRFVGGLAGYFAYDAVRYIEKKLEHSCPPDTLGLPDIVLLHTDEVAVIDNLSGKIYCIVHVDPKQSDAYEKGVARLAEIKALLRLALAPPILSKTPRGKETRRFEKSAYMQAVQETKGLIAAGDCMQVVIGQRIEKKFRAEPLALYRALRTLNPSPYMYYYRFEDFSVVGASPEILVRQEQTPAGKKITIRPLAGTRARGADAQTDKKIEEELLNDPKERAEHLMLIDLARNDIGRIAQIGSVQVTQSFAVERYSHVMHIVSNVEGMLRPEMRNMDVLRASFPAGTLSGAPKIHAMELIDRFEPTKRGVYGGACGYISYAGDMDLAIAIRTAVIKDQTLYVQAAAGVVADSDPGLEWQETEHKARALLRASEMVEEGLQ